MLGEYAVLENGSALLFTHEPHFTLLANENTPLLIGIHPHSPAGRFYQQHFDLFSRYQLHFIDPYHGIGGMGASSAQFILLFTLYYHLKKQPFSLEALLQTYHPLAWSGQGYPPSGADLVAQSIGGFIAWHPQEKTITQLTWPFETLSFHFVHTRHKVKTHEHLHTLQMNFSVNTLNAVTEQALNALKNTDSIQFCNAINSYASLLAEYQLVTDHTLALLQSLQTQHYVKAAKGCGALGADVLFIITEKSAAPALHAWINTHHLQYLCSQDKALT